MDAWVRLKSCAEMEIKFLSFSKYITKTYNNEWKEHGKKLHDEELHL